MRACTDFLMAMNPLDVFATPPPNPRVTELLSGGDLQRCHEPL